MDEEELNEMRKRRRTVIDLTMDSSDEEDLDFQRDGNIGEERKEEQEQDKVCFYSKS